MTKEEPSMYEINNDLVHRAFLARKYMDKWKESHKDMNYQVTCQSVTKVLEHVEKILDGKVSK